MSIHSPGLHRYQVGNSLQNRFIAKCAKPNENGCIEWTGSATRTGYGLIRTGPRGSVRTTAHRIAWLLQKGDIPACTVVMHRCDNPKCVNVDHLFIGSQAENMEDMVSKGRQPWKHGTPWQKLNSVDAERVRELRFAGCTQQTISEWMGCSRPQISLMLAGKHSYC